MPETFPRVARSRINKIARIQNLLKQRVRKAAEFVAEGTGQSPDEALKQICVSPQCGFSTHESGYPLTLDDEKKKLSLIRQIADDVWGQP